MARRVDRRPLARRPMAAPVNPPRSRRWRRLAFGLAGLTLVAATAAAAAHLLGPSVGSTTQFPIAALEVRGLRLLSGKQVLDASGVEVGSGLFQVDLDAVAARIDSLVWVRTARVERKPPDRLIVHLQERRRLAWIEWQGRLYGLDEEGVLLPPERLESEGIADLDLPVFRVPGFGASDATPAPGVGKTVTVSAVQRLLTWWQAALAAQPQLAREISQLEPLDDTSLRLRLVADDLEVRVPEDRVADCLATLREVLQRVYREYPNPAYIDLRFEGQAVVGMADSATVPVVVPVPAIKAPKLL